MILGGTTRGLAAVSRLGLLDLTSSLMDSSTFFQFVYAVIGRRQVAVIVVVDIC